MRPAVRNLFMVVALAVAATVLPAQNVAALVGTWQMTSESESESIHWTLQLKQADGKLTATMSTDDGQTAPSLFTYTGSTLKFKAPYQGEYYDVELKLVGGKLDGTWSGGGNSGRTWGVKAGSDQQKK